MKKILFAVPLLTVMFSFMACDPITDKEGPGASVSADELTSDLQITAESEGNNNLTVFTSPARFIKVYDASDNSLAGSGTDVKIQVLPGYTKVSYYVVTANEDGSTTKSGTKSISVSNYTKLDPMLTTLFGDGKGGFTSYKYVWNTDASDGVWGKAGYLESTGPAWWIVTKDQINDQAVDKNLTKDGLDGWFTMALGSKGVTTSRGETGSAIANSEVKKSGWDIGTLTFSGTIPLMGIIPDNNNQRQYVYQILKASDGELRLCAPDPNAGDWGNAWFWNFKRVN